MTEWTLEPDDLARVRFAHSPLVELMASVRVLQDRSRQHMYQRWLSRVRVALGDVRMDLLTALMRPGPYVPDFLTPPPSRLRGTVTEELQVVAETAPEVVRHELDLLFDGSGPPAVLQRLYDNPAGHLPIVVRELERYWKAALEPFWSRISALAMADVKYRTDRLAAGGISLMLAELHRGLAFDGDRLLINRPSPDRAALSGRGFMLLPCAFVWPCVMHSASIQYQPTVCYPVRGLAELSEPPRTNGACALAALVGHTRALLLRTLDLPHTTTELADDLGLSPAAVSQHLKILKDSGMVDRRRDGRVVLYQRTAAATVLVDARRDG